MSDSRCPIVLIGLGLSLFMMARVNASEWKQARPGWRYNFPADHSSHPEFKTEWWYFTGNLQDAAGHRFGYELTFFRDGIIPPSENLEGVSRFVVRDLKFAHLAVTDANGRRFRFAQKINRGAFDEAGFGGLEKIAWIEQWNLTRQADGSFSLEAEDVAAAVKLILTPQKPPVEHGSDGVSLKAAGGESASHYYSITRLATQGSLRIDRATHSVTGESWFDHEWATNQLAPNQVGWNWLSLQLEDGTDLMLYQMRLDNNEIDPASNGTLIGIAGEAKALAAGEYTMRPLRVWQSAKTGARYPLEWQVQIPGAALDLKIRPLLENQELVLTPLAYWEGAVEATGTRNGRKIGGRGYLELTGYAGPLRELRK